MENNQAVSSSTKKKAPAKKAAVTVVESEPVILEKPVAMPTQPATMEETGPSEVEILQKELDTLRAAFIKVATMSGHGNQIKEFGYVMWKPAPKDMSQY